MRGMVVIPRSALALFVTRVGANDEQPPVPSHQLTVLTNSLDARSHLHGPTPAADSAAIFGETVFLAGKIGSGKAEWRHFHALT
jgi:hypothetical protein